MPHRSQQLLPSCTAHSRMSSYRCTTQGRWQRQTVEFTTHPDPRSTAIYLYNFNKDADAWFDGIELTEVR